MKPTTQAVSTAPVAAYPGGAVTMEQARWLAHRRWGQFGFVDEWTSGGGQPVKAVGVSRSGVLVTFFGTGATWEEAICSVNANPDMGGFMQRVAGEIDRRVRGWDEVFGGET